MGKNMISIKQILKILENNYEEYWKCKKQLAELFNTIGIQDDMPFFKSGVGIYLHYPLEKIDISVIQQLFHSYTLLKINMFYRISPEKTIENSFFIRNDSYNTNQKFSISSSFYKRYLELGNINVLELWKRCMEQNQKKEFLKANYSFNGKNLNKISVSLSPKGLEIVEFGIKYQIEIQKLQYKAILPNSYLDNYFCTMNLCNGELKKHKELKFQKLFEYDDNILEHISIEFEKLPDYIKNNFKNNDKEKQKTKI